MLAGPSTYRTGVFASIYQLIGPFIFSITRQKMSHDLSQTKVKSNLDGA